MSKKKIKPFKVKPVFNKKNKQLNISLPKKKLPKNVRKKSPKLKSMKIEIKDCDFFKEG